MEDQARRIPTVAGPSGGTVKRHHLPLTQDPQRQLLEERIAEVRYRLAMEGECGGYSGSPSGSGSVPGSLENEEELVDEMAELERLLRVLLREEALGR